MPDLLPPVLFTDLPESPPFNTFKSHIWNPETMIDNFPPKVSSIFKWRHHDVEGVFLGLVRKWQSRMTNSKSWIVIHYLCSWGFIIPCLYTSAVMMMNLSLYIFYDASNLVFPTLSNTTSALQFVNLVDDWNHKLSTAHLRDQPTHPVWHVNLRAP